MRHTAHNPGRIKVQENLAGNTNSSDNQVECTIQPWLSRVSQTNWQACSTLTTFYLITVQVTAMFAVTINSAVVRPAKYSLVQWNWFSDVTDACNSGASSDRREPISLHQAVALNLFGELFTKLKATCLCILQLQVFRPIDGWSSGKYILLQVQ